MNDPKLRWPNWIGVVVRDLELQRRFYGETLGLRELDAGEGWVQFDLEWPNMLELIVMSDEPQYDRSRVSVGFAVDDVRASSAALEARGVETVSGVEGRAEDGAAWQYFRDPEGNLFEISQRIGEKP